MKAILVSHHHGMMPYALPPYMVLPDIKDKIGDSMEIFADCGIYSGADVFKALALGADAVCPGRAIMPGLVKDGTQGVEECICGINKELTRIMGFTGSIDVKHIDRSVLWRK